MNVFEQLARPLKDRPGTGTPDERRRAYKKRTPPDLVDPQRRAQALRAKAYPKAPENEWGLRFPHAEILRMYSEGKSFKEIARAMSLSVRTIENHAIKIRKLMGAQHMGRAVVLWDRHMRGGTK